MFPSIQPFNSGYLQVSQTHNLYYEEVGNPLGTPILFLHGGPGGGINTYVRRFFNPNHYRAILFDQRGSGKSTPYACIEENTTHDLINDIETLRKKLNIESWVVMGGSWGSTLALLYAIHHPKCVKALILRGVFLARPCEIDWLYGPNGAARIFPKDYSYFVADLSEEEKKNPIPSFLKRLTDAKPNVQLRAVNDWNRWEMGISQLIPVEEPEDFYNTLDEGLAIARIEVHYFTHNSFLPSENYILDNCDAITHIPCEIIQGRYDIVCPPQSAYELHQKLPLSNLHIIADAGHSSVERGISQGLHAALKKIQLMVRK
ncbi:MAG: prolyl aminopeptidase [Deltaproteobacteria bacterium]|nr:prolyl aminopeptidase [Deltaproteobacteria bacterium]